MSKTIAFTLDGSPVEASVDETIWEVAKRQGNTIPHLCHAPEPGYRADGNCRACMVEIEGERVLAASCVRRPAQDMVVRTASDKARNARNTVMELLVADQPARETAHDPQSKFWKWADAMGIVDSRFPSRQTHEGDSSHVAIAVNLDACIHCNLCVRACREVQVNDVIGMAYRGHASKIVFDFDTPMGESTCVACGECVQACPTGALMEADLLDEAGTLQEFPDRSVDTLCPYCGVGCQTTVHVKDDRILHIDGRNGPANEQRLCVKGRFGADYIRHPHRLTKPMIRRDDASKDRALRLDPANPWSHFREASWEEALERAAAGLRKARDASGSSALAGFGSAKGSNEEAYLFQKLVRAGFGTNNVDHCTRLCHASSVAALMEGIGSGAVTAPFTAADSADCIIVIGARPEQNHPVAATYFKNAVKRGAKLIVADPRGQGLGRHATFNLQFKAGTDVALLNAMLHTIVEEGLHDPHYLETHTEGFGELAERVRAFPPEKMADVCGINAATIRDVARLYATSQNSIIFWGMGISQSVHGTDNARGLIALALVTGHVGRPGTGLHPLRGQNNVQGASDAGLIPMFYPDYRPVDDEDNRQRYEDFWGTALDPRRGLTVVEIINAILAGEVTAMYILGENPAMSDPDQAHAREALATLEHLVVQDIFLTETAWQADVVLPASAHAEKTGTFTNTNRQVQLGREVVPLPHDARQDWWITQEIARRIGLDWHYTHPRDVFAEMAEIMPSLANITWARLEREDAVTYPCDAPDEPGNAIIFGDGFPTYNGRARIVPTELTPPDELPDDEFPMILSTGRMLEHWHTGAMTRRAQTLDLLEPEAVACLSPRDIERMQLEPGDFIRVSTRRGAITLRVRLDRDVADGTVFIPFCYTEAAANLLTNPTLDPFGKIPEFKFCAARIEPAEGVAAE
ncbi:MAG: formate dehydrogenase subunit alpha [Woeseiaceae bacterium]|nr:formate dehydrogenase subunit alpha [Gammaproteobacteria bacterium]NNK24459.1 formate dehydrogenase subunit alpha [Woeseiaceae bacterium]